MAKPEAKQVAVDEEIVGEYFAWLARQVIPADENQRGSHTWLANRVATGDYTQWVKDRAKQKRQSS